MTHTIQDRALEAEALIRSVLREGRPIAAEQPLVFDPAFDGRFVTLYDGEELVSACGILARDLVVSGGRIRVGLIGSVATAPSHRGQGHASEVLRRAEAELAADGALLALLWADDQEFYAGRGYVPIGAELDYAMAKTQMALLPEPVGVRPIEPRDAADVHTLYLQHDARVARNLAETAALLAGPSIRGLVKEVDGVVQAYALVGRGEDLGGVLHEWGGALQPVLEVFHAHLAETPADVDGLFVMCPPSHRELKDYFEVTRCAGQVGFLGMGRLLDAGAAARVLNRHTPAEVTARRDGRGAILEGPAGELRMNDQELLLALFPPKAAREVVQVVEKELGCELPELPLLPFVWGLDSI